METPSLTQKLGDECYAVFGIMDEWRKGQAMRTRTMTVSPPAAPLVFGAIVLALLLLRPTAVQGQELGAEFVGELPTQGGIALMTWSGGSVEALEDAASEVTSVWVTSGGAFVGYHPDAPGFVNARFWALFPEGQVPSQPMVVALPAAAGVDFDRTGNLVRDNPGLPLGVWFLLYEAPGAPALTAELMFTTASQCIADGASMDCDDIEVGTRARVRGAEVDGVVQVATLEVEGEANEAAASIVCSTAYRVSTSEPLTDVDTVVFADDDSVQSIPYIYLEFHAEYTTGGVDGERALRLWVTPTAEEEVIVSQLFQLPQDAAPVNQFVGGHGFTGLTYAYDPVSGAELQYWCEAI